MSGTDLAWSKSWRRRRRMRGLSPLSAYAESAICLRACEAMSGTDGACTVPATRTRTWISIK
eukprot:2891499-Rhodomonas_salina.1